MTQDWASGWKSSHALTMSHFCGSWGRAPLSWLWSLPQLLLPLQFLLSSISLIWPQSQKTYSIGVLWRPQQDVCVPIRRPGWLLGEHAAWAHMRRHCFWTKITFQCCCPPPPPALLSHVDSETKLLRTLRWQKQAIKPNRKLSDCGTLRKLKWVSRKGLLSCKSGK